MEDFSLSEMHVMQQRLLEQYKNRWEPLTPAAAKNKLLWLTSELGEVIDIVKKQGPTKANEDPATRAHLVEEMADVLMYYNEIMLCFGITPEELKASYTAKFERNMTRWK